MWYRILADLTVFLHFAYLLFAVFGGLLVLRWWCLAWVHLPAVAWAAYVELFRRSCPLTGLEDRLREAGGLQGYQGDFIGHYLMPLIYPPGLTPAIQDILGALLVISYLVIYITAWRLHQRRKARRHERGVL